MSLNLWGFIIFKMRNSGLPLIKPSKKAPPHNRGNPAFGEGDNIV